MRLRHAFTPFDAEVTGRPIPTWAYKVLLGNDAVFWLLTKMARGQLRTAFDARPDLMKDLPLEERWFVEQLVDAFIPASKRLPGTGNEGAAVDPRAIYRLEAIRAPTLIVHSRDDGLNPFAVGEQLASRVRGSRLIAFERGGHLLDGHHAQLRTEISDFLAQR